MSTVTVRSVILTRANGEEITVQDSEMETVRTNNTHAITCDGPRCAAHNGGTRVTVTINDETARKDENSVPDAFFGFIKMQPDPQKDVLLEFCSKRCVSDYLVYEYIRPLSPRQRARQMESQGVAPTSRFEQEPVSQADGEAS